MTIYHADVICTYKLLSERCYANLTIAYLNNIWYICGVPQELVFRTTRIIEEITNQEFLVLTPEESIKYNIPSYMLCDAWHDKNKSFPHIHTNNGYGYCTELLCKACFYNGEWLTNRPKEDNTNTTAPTEIITTYCMFCKGMISHLILHDTQQYATCLVCEATQLWGS